MRKSWLLPLFMVMLFLVPDVAMAGTGMGALTTVQSDLQTAISGWESPLQAAAKNLFFAFAAIEIAILAMNHGLNRKGHEDLFGSLIKKVVTLGFFLTCINEAAVWIPAIINGLEGGVTALGVTVATPSTIAGFAEKAFLGILLSPIHAAAKNASSILSDIVNMDWGSAFSAASNFFAASNPTALLGETILTFVLGLLTAISILMLALELLMVTLESYLVMAFGVIVLAGGGLRYTSKYVSSYFDYAVNVGFRLLLINAIAYLVMNSLVPLMTTMMENVNNPFQMGFQMLALGAIIALLPKKASSIATSILTGSSSFSGGELAKGMATAGVGAAAIAAAPVALAAAGGAAAGAGAFSAAAGSAGGSGGALMGATEAAQAGGAAAQGGAGSMSAGMGSSGGGAGSMESASMKSVPTPDAKGMEHMRASVQKPSASGSSTSSKSSDAPSSSGATGTGSAGSSAPAGSAPSAGSEGGSSGGGESPVAEAAEAAGVAGLTAEAAAQGTSAAQGGASAAKATPGASSASTSAPAAQGTPAAQASGPAASTAGSSAPAGSAPSAGSPSAGPSQAAGPSPSAGPSGGPAGDSSASGVGESSGAGESAPSESPSGSLPPIDASPVPAPSPNEQTELLRQMRDSMAQQNRPKTAVERGKEYLDFGKGKVDKIADEHSGGGVSGSKLDFKHMDD
ncbi:P-type conjugative transfer protein TrbL [Acidithiobacillus sulfurivorans]|uniref:P-type conjugative transfer protein TrbL n=1 Tax=Acidithiobacillus sulfurivorans TaxID=1958756 RepID=A0ABS5ZXM1_9PROT|nr:P-type conjugative transfer protein TrbL [Acidithiobacillus sulfurivorans]MBU2759944.1 P-type conjugative transfer protein TrbL [Acidithiobacillus sulfurivorans]